MVDTGDGAFLSHEHEENERGNVFVHEPSFEEVVDFIERVRKRPRVLNSSKKDEKEDGSRAKCPERVAFACTKTARHLTDAREAWATYEGCKYVGGCRPLLAERMPEVKEVTFAPVPPSSPSASRGTNRADDATGDAGVGHAALARIDVLGRWIYVHVRSIVVLVRGGVRGVRTVDKIDETLDPRVSYRLALETT